MILNLDEGISSWGSGASVLDLIFPQPETVNEIRFRNWYTARLSLLVRFDDSVQAPPKKEHLAWAAAAVRYNFNLNKTENAFQCIGLNSNNKLHLSKPIHIRPDQVYLTRSRRFD